jgi:hypothetical protein
MSTSPYDVFKAVQHARAASRRGDLAAAERWYRIAERASAIAERLTTLKHLEDRSNWRPPRNAG